MSASGWRVGVPSCADRGDVASHFVPVLYDPDDPSRARLKTFKEQYAPSLILFLLAAAIATVWTAKHRGWGDPGWTATPATRSEAAPRDPAAPGAPPRLER